LPGKLIHIKVNSIIIALIVLGVLGLLFGIIIFFVGQKFKVIEDPLIDEISEMLPGANCGGCGLAGCRAFAEALVKAKTFEGLNCPVGGNALVADIAPLLGVEAVEKDPEIAVVRCNGTYENAKAKLKYDGPMTCTFSHNLFSGESGCPHSCLGLGDCVVSCTFDAIFIDQNTGLPIVSEENCVACGACVKACPRSIIELRPKGKKSKRIYVQCVNREKGAIARKNCVVACIGCGKCVKICPHDAITMENNLAYIDAVKCKLCRKCVAECPTHAIIELNFPPRKETAVSEPVSDVSQV
jgi:Na+-translocating ferredoxin:NAD+ oxidoreductase subunit B